jgi:hypothetical protein
MQNCTNPFVAHRPAGVVFSFIRMRLALPYFVVIRPYSKVRRNSRVRHIPATSKAQRQCQAKPHSNSRRPAPREKVDQRHHEEGISPQAHAKIVYPERTEYPKKVWHDRHLDQGGDCPGGGERVTNACCLGACHEHHINTGRDGLTEKFRPPDSIGL